MAGESFFLSSAEQDFDLFDFRKVVGEGVNDGVDRCHLVQNAPGVIDGNRTGEVNEGDALLGNKQVLKFSCIR